MRMVPPRTGFALRDVIVNAVPHLGTCLGEAVEAVNVRVPIYDRIVVITDEQSRGIVPPPKAKGYIMNVASYEKTINFGAWTTINGFSEAALQYIRESESA
jgi:hypothetical protein